MVGDSLATDVAGGRAAGMFTVWLDPAGEREEPAPADVVVRSLAELLALWQDARG
jgi:FMN phosphatase YigB (HAD superfamily)